MKSIGIISVLMLLMIASGCNQLEPSSTTPELRSMGLEFQTQQQANLVTWAINNLSRPHEVSLKHIRLVETSFAFDFGNGENQYQGALEFYLTDNKGKSVTHWVAMYQLDNGDFQCDVMGGSASCVGKNCAKCAPKINLTDGLFCNCYKVSNPDGDPAECNMGTTISAGGYVMSNHELELFTVAPNFEVKF